MAKQRKTIQTLGSHDCRWPIGDPQHADFHFCGERRAEGHVYCAQHRQVAFQPSKPRYQAIEPTRRAA